jgi:hypothetical protein
VERRSAGNAMSNITSHHSFRSFTNTTQTHNSNPEDLAPLAILLLTNSEVSPLPSPLSTVAEQLVWVGRSKRLWCSFTLQLQIPKPSSPALVFGHPICIQSTRPSEATLRSNAESTQSQGVVARAVRPKSSSAWCFRFRH